MSMWKKGIQGLALGAMCFAGTVSAKDINIALVINSAGKDDKSFNQAAYEGLMRAQKELGVKTKYMVAPNDNEVENVLERFAKEGKYDLVIGVSFVVEGPVTKLADKYKDVKFAIIDSVVDKPNVRSCVFAEHEGSFVVGALASMATKTEKIGFIGGMDIPLIRRFARGYEAGAQYVNAKVKVEQNYIGNTGAAWNDPAKARELATLQYKNGADVIFHAAGGSGMGVFEAAAANKKFAIGVDSNQNHIRPGLILTSMLKRVDVAVFNAVKDVKEGKFTAGKYEFNLKNAGVDFALDEHNKSLITKDMLTKIEQIKKDIIAGKITVPDYYTEKK